MMTVNLECLRHEHPQHVGGIYVLTTVTCTSLVSTCMVLAQDKVVAFSCLYPTSFSKRVSSAFPAVRLRLVPYT